ncbi:MAG: ParD-like family protein [Gammaproteobacteria bacterium]|nr:ParD-like family protein [Gammaproteobacteria bacterium]
MAKAIKLSDELINDATAHGKAMHRTPPKQIEYWARIGKLAEENPDLPLGFVKEVLIGIEEVEAGDVTEYKFG